MARTANTDNTDTGSGTEEVKKFQVTAQVSEKFWETVRDYAKAQQYSMATFLRYQIELAVGKNPDVPDKDALYETFQLGVQVEDAVNTALKDAADKANTSKANYLRKVAADAVGYDLSQEPERVGTGEAAKRRWEVAKNADSVLAALYAKDPSMVMAIVEAQGKTLADVGILVEA